MPQPTTGGYLPGVSPSRKITPGVNNPRPPYRGTGIVVVFEQTDLRLRILDANGFERLLPNPQSVAVDTIGNVTMSWTDAISDLLGLLAPIACQNVEQFRDRAGAYLAVVDSGGTIVRAEWAEVMPFTDIPEIRKRVARGALSIASQNSSIRELQFSAVITRAARLYLRGENRSLIAP